MLPLNDSEPSRYSRYPVVTLSLIATSTLVLLYEYSLASSSGDAALREFVFRFGSVPAWLLSREGGGALTSLTALFLHADWFHLGSNMLALWVFGRRVEDACGPWRFLAFYLTCGLGANVLSTLVHWGDPRPSIGASGAVFGVMGAYLLLYPGGRIRTFLWLGLVPAVPQLRAIWVVLYFALSQLVPAFLVLAGRADYSVGYWAHLGGFFSCLTIYLFLRPDAFLRYINDAPE